MSYDVRERPSRAGTLAFAALAIYSAALVFGAISVALWCVWGS